MAQRFTAVFFTGNKSIGNEGYMKWRNVTNRKRLIRNVLSRYPESKFIHLYDKKTKNRVDYIDLS
jgi:hypothetical protein